MHALDMLAFHDMQRKDLPKGYLAKGCVGAMGLVVDIQGVTMDAVHDRMVVDCMNKQPADILYCCSKGDYFAKLVYCYLKIKLNLYQYYVCNIYTAFLGKIQSFI